MTADCQNRAALLPAVWCMITKFEGSVSGAGAGAGAGDNGCSSLVGTSAFLGNNSSMAFFPSLLSPTVPELNKTKCFYFTYVHLQFKKEHSQKFLIYLPWDSRSWCWCCLAEADKRTSAGVTMVSAAQKNSTTTKILPLICWRERINTRGN